MIDHISIDFTEGLNILTGETGAGKSILIDAVSVILGARTSAENIRQGADWLRVEAVFDTGDMAEVKAYLGENGIIDDEETLIISRKINQSGKNIITLNGCHITLAVLKKIGEYLVDIHGQHENQALLRADSQLALVDNAEPKIAAALKEYRKAYKKWRELAAHLENKLQDSQKKEQLTDMLHWQIEEIESAHLTIGEEEKLETELRLLANAEKISSQVCRSYELLEESSRGHLAVVPSLVEAKKCMENVCRYDKRLENALKMVVDALCQLEECSLEIHGYIDNMEFDGTRMGLVEDRLSVIYKLRKKYGATVEDVLSHLESAKCELDEIERYDEIVNKLKKDIAIAAKDMAEKAGELSALRQKSAAALSSEICAHLHHLGMAAAQLEIDVAAAEKYSPSGKDIVTMMFSGNVGEKVRPMNKVASGGELSRIALAIKAVCAARDKIGVMIFDEIDTGIGGRTAQMVAERISMVALHKQVLCITHLPQIACMADNHLYIEKIVNGGKSETTVAALTEKERISELARMASGDDLSQSSLGNALEMLDNAARKKAAWRGKFSA